MLDALDWTAQYGREDDPAVVHRCYEETVAVLQQGLDRLVSEVPNTLLARFRRTGDSNESAPRQPKAA